MVFDELLKYLWTLLLLSSIEVVENPGVLDTSRAARTFSKRGIP